MQTLKNYVIQGCPIVIAMDITSTSIFTEVGAQGLDLPGTKQITYVNPTLKLVQVSFDYAFLHDSSSCTEVTLN